MPTALTDLEAHYDAVVVGGRCAGAATALLLARAGLRVLVVEQAARGSDTLSTHALMRGAVLQLSRWGLLDGVIASGAPRIETTTFYYGGEPVEIRIKPRDGVDALYAPRRTVLDPLIADAAAAAGADVVYRMRVTGLLRDARQRVNGVVVESGGVARAIRTGLVIGADGLHSVVSKQVAAVPYRVGRHMSGVIYARLRGVGLSGYHWYYATGAGMGVIPTNGGETLVFVAVTREQFLRTLRLDLPGSFAALVKQMAPALLPAVDAGVAGGYHGFAGHPGIVRQAWGPGWALVGDAGYFKDPITAHGMTDALRDAELLAQAVLRGTDSALADYQARRDDLAIRLFEISDQVASYAWDIPRVQALHKALSEEMQREVAYLARLAADQYSAKLSSG
jgi:flavin-dependent dehydrogenase